MSKWQEKRLGEVVNYITRGITPKYTANGIKVINQKCIRDYKINLDFCKETLDTTNIGKKYVQYGDILINSTGTGTLGRVACSKIQNMPITFDSHVTLCRVGKEYNNFFIGYYLHSIEKELENFGCGSTNQTELNINDIKKIKINIPDLVTQEKMADILSTYDDLIENNNRRIDILEQMAQEIYKEWFVRFRFPGHEKVKFINGLPEGWEVVKLGDLVNIKGGKRLPTGKDFCIEQTEHPYIRIRDISKYKFIPLTENMMYIDNATYNILNRFTVKKGDLLISIVGTIGLVACVGSTLNGANLTENCVNITEVRHFTKSYLYHYLKSSQGQGELYSGIVGVSQPKLPIYNIKKFKLLKPSQKLIIDFTNLVADIDSKMNNLLEQNQNLIKQQDLLLPRLMSGKLEV